MGGLPIYSSVKSPPTLTHMAAQTDLHIHTVNLQQTEKLAVISEHTYRNRSAQKRHIGRRTKSIIYNKVKNATIKIIIIEKYEYIIISEQPLYVA